jgi:hypothetical protein
MALARGGCIANRASAPVELSFKLPPKEGPHQKKSIPRLEIYAREGKTLYMTSHSRIPALAAIAITAMAGLAFFTGAGQFRKTDISHASLGELEKRVQNTKNPRDWLAYADKLSQLGLHGPAVKAYEQTLNLQPDFPEARFKLGLALGQSNKDAFFEYVTKLSMNFPKQAVDLLKQPELASLHGDFRWAAAVAGAQAQAVD